VGSIIIEQGETAMTESLLKGSLFLGALGTVLAFGFAPPAQAKNAAPVVSSVVSLDPTLGELPESITSDDDGHVYFSLVNGEIRELSSNGTTTTVATVTLPAGGNLTGIKVGPDGLIYVMSSSFTADPPAAFVWRADPATGDVEQFAALDPTGFPNDIAFEDDGTFFVTDPFLGLVYHVDASGQATVAFSGALFQGNPAAPAFAAHEFGADGIAFDGDHENLYVANIDYGRIIRIPFDCHRAGTPQVFVESAALKGTDGIAVDRSGTIYAAVNTQNLIAAVDKHGGVSVYAQSALFDSPASIAFGSGHGDKKTAYIANFAINSVQAGLPAHPGILSMPVPVPGVELP
jgi:sugar lactone lactonase YvrE